jgi:DNA repair exonuclease SbcCD ATPase subunit
MRKTIVLLLILCGFHSAHSQDCLDKLTKQAVEIDSLQKLVNTEKASSQQSILDYQRISKNLSDTIKALTSDLSKLEKFKADKKVIDTQLEQKNDSIVLLKDQIAETSRQISGEKQAHEQKLLEEKEKGKNEALADVVNSYKNKTIDDLIKSSTKLSVRRDRQFVSDNAEVKAVLSDLETYFNAEELLAKKMDAGQLNDIRVQLNEIKQQSALLDQLRENLEYYKNFNDELKKTIEKLVDLDKRKVADSDTEIQKLKFNEIVSELADYMYNYYDYGNYPYLSDIVLEIIKRKRPNADADITDLLKKLQ